MLEQKNPLILAFIGDAVQTLYVRAGLADKDAKLAELHKLASSKVCAKAQSEHLAKVQDTFSATEQDIANRARNCGHHTLPKNADPADYHRATALEAVIGYNYLAGNIKRVEELV